MADVESFDLRRQPWLPVRTVRGEVQDVSLVEVFRRADELQALTGEVPTQVLALYRLLLAVLLRAVDWDRDDPVAHWRRAWRGEVDLAGDVRRYLNRFADRFDLLHPRSPFLQVAGLRTARGEWSPLTSLIADVPNNAQYFTTRAGRSLESMSLAEAARWLVHAHAFDVSGIKSGALGDGRVKGGKGYPIGVGWAGQIGGVLIEGATLRETLLLNLVLLDTEGALWPAGDRPVWERPPLGSGVEQDARVPQGLADQLTWPSRRIRLQVAGAVAVGVLIANGDPLAPHDRFRTETMTGWRRSIPQERKLKSSTRVYMPRLHRPQRVSWRGLPALLAQVGVPERWRDPDLGRPPWVLNWIYLLLQQQVLPEDFPIQIRAVGIAYGSNNAVIDEIVDDSLFLDAVLLGEQGRGLRSAVVDAVAAADRAVQALADLAGNLTAAAGGEAGGPRDRAWERGFFALDMPFRDWLGSLDSGDDPVQRRLFWERTVRREIAELGGELVSGAGIAAWVGREHLGRRIDSALASLWFDAALAGALPLAAAGVEPDSPTHPDRRAAWTDAVSRTRVAGRPAAAATPGAEHPDLQLEAFVHRRVADLAHRCTTDDAAAAASLGRLRRAVDREPRSDPMIWPDTLAGLPQALIGRGDRPSRYERAAHSAITLFAVHQQARTTSMHRDGIGLGRAVYRLGGQDFSGQVTLRRFQAVATASSYPDTIHHLRGLITQLRSAGVGLDYGLLARDLARLQSPRSADSVRLTWGRGYHWRPENDDEVPATGDPASAATT